ncbi:MAG: carbohydrate ABC transporter permease [Anaerolineae bacterium]
MVKAQPRMGERISPVAAQWIKPLVHRARAQALELPLYAFLTVLALLGIIPIVWMFFSSLKSLSEFRLNQWLWPRTWQWVNYSRVWMGANFGLYFANSVIMTVSSVSAMIVVGSMAGYALARYQFPLRNGVLYYFISGQVVPAQVLLIPLFIMIRFLGLLNTRPGLILIYTAAAQPFVVFNMQAFFKGIPQELEEAARIDGASEFRIFWQIMLPLARGGVGTMAIFQSMWIWNEFLFALVFAGRSDLRTLPIGIFNVIGQYFTDYPVFFAGLMVATLPIVIVYILTVRYVIRGVGAGAVKG